RTLRGTSRANGISEPRSALSSGGGSPGRAYASAFRIHGRRREGSMAIEFGGSIVLDKPVEDVYRFLTDPDRDTNWRRPHVLSSRMLTDGPLAVGSRFETVNRFWG